MAMRLFISNRDSSKTKTDHGGTKGRLRMNCTEGDYREGANTRRKEKAKQCIGISSRLRAFAVIFFSFQTVERPSVSSCLRG
jgi:hypothetical protein